MPKGGPAGSLQDLDVIAGDFELPAQGPERPEGADWPTGETSPFLTCEDVFGNRYRFDIAATEGGHGVAARHELQSGPALRQWKVAGALMPEGKDPRALPHMMGVHAYGTEWAGSSHVSLDLRVHNGLTAGSRERSAMDQPVGTVYWKSLDLHLPAGWVVDAQVRDPFLGAQAPSQEGWTVLPLVMPYPDGKLHMIGPQGQFIRRLTLRRASDAAASRAGKAIDGLMYCRPGKGLASWFSLPNYLPQMGILPTWDQLDAGGQAGRAEAQRRLVGERNELRAFLEGSFRDKNLYSAEVMGWCHPRGYSYGGAAGGVEIFFVEGHLAAWAASQEGYESLTLMHTTSVARQPDAQYTKDGEPAGVEVWRDANGVVPFDFRTNGFMVPPEFKFVCKRGPAPNPHVAEVQRRGLRPPYDLGNPHEAGGQLPGDPGALFAWFPHDGEHLRRHTKNILPLVWLGNDPLAKDDLHHVGAQSRLTFNEGPHKREEWSAGVTLAAFLAWAKTAPHHGIPIRRDTAWALDMICADYQTQSETRRAELRPYFEKVVELFDVASMPNGLIQRVNQNDVLDARYDACQTFQVMFLLHAQRCVNESVLRDADPARFQLLADLQLKALDYLYFGPAYTHFQGERWGQQVSQAGPYFRFAVAPTGMLETVPYCFEDTWGPNYLPPDGFENGSTPPTSRRPSNTATCSPPNPARTRATTATSPAPSPSAAPGTWEKFAKEYGNTSAMPPSTTARTWPPWRAACRAWHPRAIGTAGPWA
ncbi:MAG: hypothetical protein R3E96_05195 [Planctomycetota bacterium]